MENSTNNIMMEPNIMPIVDSLNPPISVDGMMLGTAPGATFRLCGLAGTPFPVKEEKITTPNGESTLTWVRPTCVIDFSLTATASLLMILVDLLRNNPELLKAMLQIHPEMRGILRTSLPQLLEEVEKNA